MNSVEYSAFLRERQTGVGASDAPNLVGVGFRTALDVYRDKTEAPVVRPPVGYLRRGLELEPIVADMYAELMGVQLGKRACMDRHPKRPWQFCHIDRMRPDDIPVQLKTCAGFGDQWGPSGTDQVPGAYRVQCLHEMGVIGAHVEDLIALDVIMWEPRVYRLAFDAEAFEVLTRIEAEFWHHVVDRVPFNGKSWSERVDTMPGGRLVVQPGKIARLPDEVEALIVQRLKVGGVRDEASEEFDRLGRELRNRMGDAEVAVCNNWQLKLAHVKAGIVPAHERDAYTRLDIRPIKARAV